MLPVAEALPCSLSTLSRNLVSPPTGMFGRVGLAPVRAAFPLAKSNWTSATSSIEPGSTTVTSIVSVYLRPLTVIVPEMVNVPLGVPAGM